MIESPKEAISARLDLIENAGSTIDLAYYKWVDGKVSDLMLGSILEAADRGVKVRILLHGILQLANLGGPVNEIFLGFKPHPNIELKVYEPFNPLTPIAWNNRMHDKMILVDTEFGLICGRNIEDRFYIDDAHKDGIVKDREVLIRHDKSDQKDSTTVINKMEDYYDSLWNYKHTKEKYKKRNSRKIKKGELAVKILKDQHKNHRTKFLNRYFPDLKATDWVEESLPTNNIRFISNSLGRMNQDPNSLRVILQLSAAAEESVFIQSPYFVPSKSMLSIVEDYDIDPKKTTLFTNSEAVSPNLPAIAAYNNHRKGLVDSGANIFEYQGPRSTHAKSSIFDEQISVSGTFNVDPRSSYINTESMVIIDSEEFAEELKKGIAANFEDSLRVDNDYTYLKNGDLDKNKISPFKK